MRRRRFLSLLAASPPALLFGRKPVTVIKVTGKREVLALAQSIGHVPFIDWNKVKPPLSWERDNEVWAEDFGRKEQPPC